MKGEEWNEEKRMRGGEVSIYARSRVEVKVHAPRMSFGGEEGQLALSVYHMYLRPMANGYGGNF